MFLAVTVCALLRVAAFDDAALTFPAADAVAWAAEEAFGADDDHGRFRVARRFTRPLGRMRLNI